MLKAALGYTWVTSEKEFAGSFEHDLSCFANEPAFRPFCDAFADTFYRRENESGAHSQEMLGAAITDLGALPRNAVGKGANFDDREVATTAR